MWSRNQPRYHVIRCAPPKPMPFWIHGNSFVLSDKFDKKATAIALEITVQPISANHPARTDMTEAAVARFFASPRFAVAGASNDSRKFGYKILAWYVQHSLPVTPINPREQSIRLLSRELPTASSPKALPEPAETSLSFVTPPPVTLALLKEAREVGIQAVWLQPGTFDDEVLSYANSNFPASIGGDGGLGSEGWCVLVDGEDGLEAAGREWKQQKL